MKTIAVVSALIGFGSMLLVANDKETIEHLAEHHGFIVADKPPCDLVVEAKGDVFIVALTPTGQKKLPPNLVTMLDFTKSPKTKTEITFILDMISGFFHASGLPEPSVKNQG